MLYLYQFELCPYCEKVRFILDYKRLDYSKIEVTPGVGQLELLRLSGKTQVPVLKDGESIITDSTEIANYLERKYPEPALIPRDALQKGQCLLIEAWADASIGVNSRKAFVGALNQYGNFRSSILPRETPDFLKSLVRSVPGELLDLVGTGLGLGGESVKEALKNLKQDLEALSLILANRPYLTGSQPTLADFAVAGLSLTLKFPSGTYLNIPEELKGKGIPGLADHSAYDVFFNWRDRLYADYRKDQGPTNNFDPTPTSIEIN
ncbi:glutathione S-transferase family protein [Gloeocapsa sp. PCC 73106]|uniref:glutathione S-transferase family protein n=1 Tax=Gloeocapsa sp. PCC 73106 TaxID=102232 RepID=UPI0002ACC916|nr:glutathione S-transferase family protein [Gloeocapsa sp. PCC 73106]ELR97999.1 glutathione S-transferase [Gloeocapsa sp. PCC 73106]